MSTLEILRAARELISDPVHWTKHTYCNGDGSYCMVGACARAAGIELVRAFNPTLATFERESPVVAALKSVTWPDSPHAFNDDHSHADVLAAFDKAIAGEEAEVTA